MWLDAIAGYYPIYRNNAQTMLIFDVFSTFLDLTRRLNNAGLRILCEYLKCYIDFSFAEIKQ